MGTALTEHDVRKWLGDYKTAWERQDPALFTTLFTGDCEYRDTPFSEPIKAKDFREFWSSLAREQRDNHMTFEDVAMLDGRRALAFWRAQTTKNSRRMEGDGVMLLTFADDGRCCDLREWQHARGVGEPLHRRVFQGS